MKRTASSLLALALVLGGCGGAPEPVLVPPPAPQASASAAPEDALAERPIPPPAPAFVPQVPVLLEGPGGSAIWLLERHTLPLVSIAVASSIGGAVEPRELGGLSAVTADMLDEGAGARDALAFSAALEELGAHVGSSSDREKSVVALDVLAGKVDLALPLLADAILRPRHDAKDFARVADLWKNALKSRADDPSEVARLVSPAVLFGLDHAYGRPLDGTLVSAARVKVGDVTRFHRAVWRPDRVTFVVVGDVTREAIAPMLAKAFAGWTPPKEPALSFAPGKTPPPPPRGVIVDRPDAPQIVMTIIREGVTAASDAYPRLAVLNVALGGSFTSRLNQNLREDHGYTYGARSAFVAQRASGLFLARASIRTDAIEPALKETLKEIDALAKDGLGEDEVKKARSLVRAQAVERYGSIGAIAHGLAENAALGLPIDHDARELLAEGSVTKAELAPLAQKYLALGAASIVLVGPRKPAEAALRAVGIDSPELRDAEGKPVAEKHPGKAPKKRLSWTTKGMAQVKGSAILARLQYVEAKLGREARERLICSLSGASRDAIHAGVLPHQWAPYDLFIEVNVEIDRLFGKGDLALCYEMGRFGAEVNLPTLYRIFYRLGSPLFVFRKAARVWEVHYDSGRLVPVQEGERLVRVKILDFDQPHRAHCLSVLGWAARSIELSGATLVRAEEERCRLRGDAACEMVCAWKSA